MSKSSYFGLIDPHQSVTTSSAQQQISINQSQNVRTMNIDIGVCMYMKSLPIRVHICVASITQNNHHRVVQKYQPLITTMHMQLCTYDLCMMKRRNVFLNLKPPCTNIIIPYIPLKLIFFSCANYSDISNKMNPHLSKQI